MKFSSGSNLTSIRPGSGVCNDIEDLPFPDKIDACGRRGSSQRIGGERPPGKGAVAQIPRKNFQRRRSSDPDARGRRFVRRSDFAVRISLNDVAASVKNTAWSESLSS